MEKCPAVWEEGKTSLPDNDNYIDDNDNDNGMIEKGRRACLGGRDGAQSEPSHCSNPPGNHS